jgi:hypothetical protein
MERLAAAADDEVIDAIKMAANETAVKPKRTLNHNPRDSLG